VSQAEAIHKLKTNQISNQLSVRFESSHNIYQLRFKKGVPPK